MNYQLVNGSPGFDVKPMMRLFGLQLLIVPMDD